MSLFILLLKTFDHILQIRILTEIEKMKEMELILHLLAVLGKAVVENKTSI